MGNVDPSGNAASLKASPYQVLCSISLRTLGGIPPVNFINSMYYLVINGAQQGPYSKEQIAAMLDANEIRHDTLGWTEGQAEWQPLDRVVGMTKLPPAVPAEAQVARVGMFSFLGGVGMTLAIIGAILLGLLVIAGGFIGYFVYVGNGLDKSSKAYVDEAIPAIVTNWSPDELVKRESKAFQKATNDEQLVKLFSAFRRLGALKEYKGCKGDANMNYTTESGSVVTATYLGHATFDNGDAEIKVVLVQQDGQWKIQGFRIDSPAFLK
jgi:hypothetical protein